jgi:hypothetical protein
MAYDLVARVAHFLVRAQQGVVGSIEILQRHEGHMLLQLVLDVASRV